TDLAGRSAFEDRARECVEQLEREFYRAHVISVDAAPAAPAITYQLPVDPDADGDVTDANEQIEWGSPEPTGDVLGGQIRMEWRLDRTVSEATLKEDINRDGDRNDVFKVGRLVRVTSTGKTRPFGPAAVATSSPNPGGDVSGDGVADPPFVWDTKQ